MVFTCWVGRPESVRGSGCLSTPPQTALSCTEPLSNSSPRENKLLKCFSEALVHAFAPDLTHIHSSYLLSEKCCSKWQGTGGAGERCLDPVPTRRATDPLPISHQLSPLSADPEKSKTSATAGRISPCTSVVSRASPAKCGLLGDWDFVKLHQEQKHLLLLKQQLEGQEKKKPKHCWM